MAAELKDAKADLEAAQAEIAQLRQQLSDAEKQLKDVQQQLHDAEHGVEVRHPTVWMFACCATELMCVDYPRRACTTWFRQ